MNGDGVRSQEIRAVVFDLDGTLRHNQPGSTDFFIDHAVRLGVQATPEQRRQAVRWSHYYWAQSEELLADFKTYESTGAAFWHNYARRQLEALGCSAGCSRTLAAPLFETMQNVYQPEDWVAEDVRPTLDRLREAGLRLAVLSNRREPCQAYLETLELAEFFDLALVAGEVNVWKPDPGIFTAALARLETAAGETLYLGDNYYADILGARGAGLPAVLLDPDEIFAEIDCPKIKQVGELPSLLNQISLSGLPFNPQP